jgi:hypothetical protein
VICSLFAESFRPEQWKYRFLQARCSAIDHRKPGCIELVAEPERIRQIDLVIVGRS